MIQRPGAGSGRAGLPITGSNAPAFPAGLPDATGPGAMRQGAADNRHTEQTRRWVALLVATSGGRPGRSDREHAAALDRLLFDLAADAGISEVEVPRLRLAGGLTHACE